MLSVGTDDGSTQSGSLIDEIVREGARRMPAAARAAEVDQCMAESVAETDEYGRCPVVRNVHHRPRTVITAAGPVEVGSPAAALAMVVSLARAGTRFANGVLAEREEQAA